MRIPIQRCLLIPVAWATAVAFGAAAGQEAAPPAAMPPDCLVAGVLTEARTFCHSISEALPAQEGGDYVLAYLGERLGDASLAGVDLDDPIRFFYMNPRKYTDPWVYVFRAGGESVFEDAPAGPSGQGSGARVRSSGGVTTVCGDEAAARAVLEYREKHPDGPAFGVPGQLRLRADVGRIVELFGAEIAAEVAGMKRRMGEAMERLPAPQTAQAETEATRRELDVGMALLGQVLEAEAGIELTTGAAATFLTVRAAPGSALARGMDAQPEGSLALVSGCPHDAVLLATHNLSMTAVFTSVLRQAFGARRWLAPADGQAGPEGMRALAVLPATEPGSALELLYLATGAAAERAEARWKRLLEATEGNEEPVTLRAVEPNPGPNEGPRVAELVPNERALGAAGVNAVRLLFGPGALAALDRTPDRCALVVGQKPNARIAELARLQAEGGRSLRRDAAFVRSLEGIPENPNLLLYASPEGIRQWLALGGIAPERLSAMQTGIIAALRFAGDGRLQAALKLPTLPIREAVLSQRVEPPPQVRPPGPDEEAIEEP